MTRLLTFPDNYTLNFQASGNTAPIRNRHEIKENQNPSGAYQICDESGEILLIMEVFNDKVRSHYFTNSENHKVLVDKISATYDYLGIDYSPSAANLTRWIVLSEEEQKVLDDNFEGVVWHKISARKVIFRDTPMIMKKEFSEKSLFLLYLMVFGGCEEGFVQLLKNGTKTTEECPWCRIPLALLVARYGTIGMMESLEKEITRSGHKSTALVREALRNKDQKIAHLVISWLAEETKTAVFEIVLRDCLSNKAIDACLLLCGYDFTLKQFHRGDDVLKLWKEVIALRSLPLLEKIYDKVPSSHLVAPAIKLLADEVCWWGAVKWFEDRGKT